MTNLDQLFRRKPVDELTSTGAEGVTLRRTLGPLSLMALGIGAIIGAGLFTLTGIAAADNAGPAVVLSFLIAALGCAFAGMCYSELASMIPIAGSAYTYAYAALGELAAWIIGWDLVLEYAMGAGTVAVGWSGYVLSLLRDLNVHIPAALAASPFETVQDAGGRAVSGIVNLPAVLIVLLMSLLVMRGIQEAARTNAVIVVVKIAIVLLFIAFGASYVKGANYHPFIPPNTGTFGEFGWSGVLRGAGTVFFAYLGFDVVSSAAQEAKRPGRDMPIGILGSLVICTVLYIAFGLVLTGILNFHDMKGDSAPVATAIDRTPYAFLQEAVKIGIICGFTTVILVLLLGQSRIFFAMAEDRLLPRVFAKLHPQWRTPYLSNLIFMVFIGLLAGFVPIDVLGHMTSIGTLLAFVIVCGGVLVLRRLAPDLPRGYRVPLVPLVPTLGILTCLTMMVSLGGMTWLRLVIWLGIGLLIFFGYSRRNSRVTSGPAPAGR